MKKKWRHWAFCAVLAVGSALGASLLSDVRFFQILNLKAYDAHFVARDFFGKPPAIPNIVLLLADQKTLDSPSFSDLRDFWHKHYATVIRAAGQAGAKVIGLDLAFGAPVEKYEPDYDRLLGEAVSTSPVPVVCAYATEINTNPEAQRIPINMLSAALGLAGFANLTADSDDFVRRQELTEAPAAQCNRSAARTFARPTRRRKVRRKRRRMAEWPARFSGPHHPHRIGPKHRHQLRRTCRHLPQRLSSRFRECGESRKHGSVAEMGERQNRSAGIRRTQRPSGHSVCHALQRNEMADARRGDPRQHGAHSAHPKLPGPRSTMGTWRWRYCWPPRLRF